MLIPEQLDRKKSCYTNLEETSILGCIVYFLMHIGRILELHTMEESFANGHPGPLHIPRIHGGNRQYSFIPPWQVIYNYLQPGSLVDG